MSQTVQTLLEQAVRMHQAGDAAAAEPLYLRVLEARPDHLDAKYLLATAQLQTGQFAESIEAFQDVVSRRRDLPDVHNNLGVAYKALGRWEEAAKAFQEAIKVDPHYEQAFFNLGRLMESRQLFADAEKCYRHALSLNSKETAAREGLAGILKAQERWSESETCYRELIEINSDNLHWKVDLAFVLAKRERLNDAAELYLEIIEARPNFHEIHSSLSYVYERQGRLEEAAERARQAVELCPEYAEAHNNLGTALRSLHHLDEACACFARARDLQSDSALFDFNFGTTHLLAGDYRHGWSGYSKHTELVGATRHSIDNPVWTGEVIRGKTLLVYADQGFGDTIQFVRFLKQTKERSQANVVFECPPELVALMEGQVSADQIVAEGDHIPSFDVQIPLAGLPELFDVDLDTVSEGNAYLSSSFELSSEIEKLIDEAPSSQLKVGLVWQGNPLQARDVVRSCPLVNLMPLFDVANVRYFSLQVGPEGAEQLVKIAPERRPIELGSRLRNFSETAAVMSKLDLIVTVDTAIAHLAGALGRPVWNMLCHTPDWRWHLNRDDSPWYPSMKLFRQPTWGDWASVVEQVVDNLQTWLESPVD